MNSDQNLENVKEKARKIGNEMVKYKEFQIEREEI